MGKRDDIENELERDSQIYDAFTKGHGEGRAAGLKEALEMVGDNPWFADLVRTIRSRIGELEKGST